MFALYCLSVFAFVIAAVVIIGFVGSLYCVGLAIYSMNRTDEEAE